MQSERKEAFSGEAMKPYICYFVRLFLYDQRATPLLHCHAPIYSVGLGRRYCSGGMMACLSQLYSPAPRIFSIVLNSSITRAE